MSRSCASGGQAGGQARLPRHRAPKNLALEGTHLMRVVSSLPAGQHLACRPKLAHFSWRAKDGGEGRTRTFEAARATDLQSAAFDRFATSPAVCVLETR